MRFWNTILFHRARIGISSAHAGRLLPSILCRWLQYRDIVDLYHNFHAKHKHWDREQANLRQESTEGVDGLDGKINQ